MTFCLKLCPYLYSPCTLTMPNQLCYSSSALQGFCHLMEIWRKPWPCSFARKYVHKYRLNSCKCKKHDEFCFIADFPLKVTISIFNTMNRFSVCITWWPLFVVVDIVDVCSVGVTPDTVCKNVTAHLNYWSSTMQPAAIALCPCVFVHCVCIAMCARYC